MVDSATTNYEFNRPAPRGPLWPLEASAGTGKTWTIENFVADYLAEGTILPEEVVIVTFTKAAAAELRSRVRNNISAIVRGENEADANRHYSSVEKDHLRRALANFGQIRITTIHGFAQRCLLSLGDQFGGISPNIDTKSFRKSVLGDVVRSLSPEELFELSSEPKFFDRAASLIELAASNPAGHFMASKQSIGADAVIALASKARKAIADRKEFLGITSYDDLLVRLLKRLRLVHDAETVASGIKVLLIDEFQDTDSLQWEIFKTIESRGHLKAFVVVGDPKQAIYGFRGGDVQVYREAVPMGSANFLAGNRRSTQAFVDASNIFFEHADFGLKLGINNQGLPIIDGLVANSVEIPYHRVEAKGQLREHALGPAWFFRDVKGRNAQEVKRNILRDISGYVESVVGHDQIPDPETGELRVVEYSDICVLGSSNAIVRKYADAFHSAGIPASVLGGSNVLGTNSAIQWRMLLEAIQHPSKTSSARLYGASWFAGRTLAEVARNRNDDLWLAELQKTLVNWHSYFVNGERREFFDRVIEESNVLHFLSGLSLGARNITDIRHVAEILSERSYSSFDELLEFLDENSHGNSDDGSDSETEGGEWTRRVDGDRPAVRLMTIHKSKGLQFPIVLLPYLDDYLDLRESTTAYRAYREGIGLTLLDATATGGTAGASMKKALKKSEQMRAGYVALTRAQVRNVLWTWKEGSSQPLFSSHAEREMMCKKSSLFGWDGRIAKKDSQSDVETEVPREPNLAISARKIGIAPGRFSFTTITNALSAPVETDVVPDSEPIDSEGSVTLITSLSVDTRPEVRGSAILGKVVHRVLERLDSDIGDEKIYELVQGAAEEFGLSLSTKAVEASDIVELVKTAIYGDLGSAAPGKRLVDFRSPSRLPEVGFDLTLRQGVTVSAIMATLQEHLSEDVNFAEWLRSIQVQDRDLPGFLTGSIDAILATGEAESPKFLIIDYKSNRLSEQGPQGYGVDSMRQSMSDHHYQLQALLYLVALHRYLRSRLGGTYDYETYVGGAAYLYIRGMRREVPGAGVMHLKPSSACIEALSNLFDGN